MTISSTVRLTAIALLYTIHCGTPPSDNSNMRVAAPLIRPCHDFSLAGLYACQADTHPDDLVITMQKCGDLVVATDVVEGLRFASDDNGFTFQCDPSAACPEYSEIVAAFCRQPY